MTAPRTEPTDVDDLLVDILRRVDAGEAIDRDDLLTRHPEFADELRSFFDSEDLVAQLAGPVVATDAIQSSETILSAEPPPNPAPAAARDTETNAAVELGSSRAGGRPAAKSSTGFAVGDTFGRYRVVKTLGSGAMGDVYLAEDTLLNRNVALKLPKFGGDNPELVERFYTEARAAATLRHTGICPVYDVGEIDGKQYITMAYIPGRPLSDYAKSKTAQPVRQVVKVVRKLCLALHVAHEAGVVHRDVKPANVMIDKTGEPVVMDFGLARQTQSTDVRLTRSGAIMGTPAYMSPEQVEGRIDDVGPASDQFSLGGVLYEMLTGHLPFEGSSVVVVMSRILNDDAQPPSGLRPEVDAELDAICLQMLARNVENRYASLGEVADRLAEWLRNDKSTRDSGLSGSVDDAPLKRDESSTDGSADGSSAIVAAETIENRGGSTRVERLADRPRPRRPRPQPAKANARSRSAWILGGLAAGGLLLLGLVLLLRTPNGTLRVEVEDGAGVEVLVDGETIDIRDAHWEGRKKASEHGLALMLGGVEVPFDEERKQFVAGNDRRIEVVLDDTELRSTSFDVRRSGTTVIQIRLVADLEGFPGGGNVEPGTGSTESVTRPVPVELAVERGAPGLVRTFGSEYVDALAFSPDGRTLAALHRDGESRRIRFWDVESGTENLATSPIDGSTKRIHFTPDGGMLIGRSSRDPDLLRVAVSTGRVERSSLGLERAAESVVPHPTLRDRFLATAQLQLRRYEPNGTSQLVADVERPLYDLDLSANGGRCAAAGPGPAVSVFFLEEQRRTATLLGHTGLVLRVSISADGRRVASAGDFVRVWDVDAGAELLVVPRQLSFGTCLGITPDGRRVVFETREVTNNSTRLCVWSIDRKVELSGFETPAASPEMAVHPGGRLVATAGRELSLWRIPDESDLRTLPSAPRVDDREVANVAVQPVQAILISPDGRTLVTSHSVAVVDKSIGERGEIRVWDAESLELRHRAELPRAPMHVHFTPDGGRILAVRYDNQSPLLSTVDIETGRVEAIEPPAVAGQSLHDAVFLDADGTSMLFAPNGKIELVRGGGRPTTLWESRFAKNSIFASDDFSRFAHPDEKGVVHVHGLLGEDESSTLRGLDMPAQFVFTRDGTQLIGRNLESLRVWDLASGGEVWSLSDLGGTGARALDATADGSLVVLSADSRETARTSFVTIVDGDTGRVRDSFRAHETEIRRLAISDDGRTLFTGSAHELKRWNLDAPAGPAN